MTQEEITQLTEKINALDVERQVANTKVGKALEELREELAALLPTEPEPPADPSTLPDEELTIECSSPFSMGQVAQEFARKGYPLGFDLCEPDFAEFKYVQYRAEYNHVDGYKNPSGRTVVSDVDWLSWQKREAKKALTLDQIKEVVDGMYENGNAYWAPRFYAAITERIKDLKD